MMCIYTRFANIWSHLNNFDISYVPHYEKSSWTSVCWICSHNGELSTQFQKYYCDIWCIYRFCALIDGVSALGVVYDVSL